MKIAGLTREYIQVRRNKDEITYGGDHGVFAGALADSPDGRKCRLGCGVTAFGDLLLYLANNGPQYHIKENEEYTNRVLSLEEYKSYYNWVYDFLGGIPPKANRGLSGIRLQGRFNQMAHRQGWKLRARWGISGRRMYGRILEMLHEDLPVILCIPIMLEKRKKDDGIIFYKKYRGQYRKIQRVNAHYITVTGVITEDGGPYLEIASWGKKFYINWQEYETLIHTHFLGTVLGNILYIRRRGKSKERQADGSKDEKI